MRASEAFTWRERWAPRVLLLGRRHLPLQQVNHLALRTAALVPARQLLHSGLVFIGLVFIGLDENSNSALRTILTGFRTGPASDVSRITETPSVQVTAGGDIRIEARQSNEEANNGSFNVLSMRAPAQLP